MSGADDRPEFGFAEFFTDALIEEFGGSDPVRDGEEALERIRTIQAQDGSLSTAQTPGQKTQRLSASHSAIVRRCSDAYSDLKRQNPGRSREAINKDPRLRELNAARLAVRAAMKASQRLAHGSSRSSFSR